MGKDLAIAEAQLRDYQARLGKPFTLDAYLAELTTLRDQLKAGLSATAHEPGKEQGPSVSELAERIKAMKAANSVEATPQRVGQKQSTAEEPITARIRRRANSAQDSAAVEPEHSTPREDLQDWVRHEGTGNPDTLNPRPAYQDRLKSREVDADKPGKGILKPTGPSRESSEKIQQPCGFPDPGGLGINDLQESNGSLPDGR